MNSSDALSFWNSQHSEQPFNDDSASKFLQCTSDKEFGDDEVIGASRIATSREDFHRKLCGRGCLDPLAPCEDDNIIGCARCLDRRISDIVLWTTGWSNSYHAKRECTWLRGGQEMVERRGGTPAPIVSGTVNQARSSGKEACQVCYPTGHEPHQCPFNERA